MKEEYNKVNDSEHFRFVTQDVPEKEAVLYLLNVRLEQLERRQRIGVSNDFEKKEVRDEIEKVKQLIKNLE